MPDEKTDLYLMRLNAEIKALNYKIKELETQILKCDAQVRGLNFAINEYQKIKKDERI